MSFKKEENSKGLPLGFGIFSLLRGWRYSGYLIYFDEIFGVKMGVYIKNLIIKLKYILGRNIFEKVT